MPKAQPTSLHLDDETRRMIEELKKSKNRSLQDVVRQAVRLLHRHEITNPPIELVPEAQALVERWIAELVAMMKKDEKADDGSTSASGTVRLQC